MRLILDVWRYIVKGINGWKCLWWPAKKIITNAWEQVYFNLWSINLHQTVWDLQIDILKCFYHMQQCHAIWPHAAYTYMHKTFRGQVSMIFVNDQGHLWFWIMCCSLFDSKYPLDKCSLTVDQDTFNMDICYQVAPSHYLNQWSIFHGILINMSMCTSLAMPLTYPPSKVKCL